MKKFKFASFIKKLGLTTFLVLTIFIVAACSNNSENKDETTNDDSSKQEETNTPSNNGKDNSDDKNEMDDQDDADNQDEIDDQDDKDDEKDDEKDDTDDIGEVDSKEILKKLAGKSYTFDAGTNWQTTLDKIAEDGNFEGIFYDGSGRETTKEYRLAAFSGKMKEMEKESETNYKVEVEDFNLKDKPGEKKNEKGEKVIYVDKIPGLEEVEDFTVFLKGAKFSELPSEVQESLKDYGVESESLELNIIYNEDTKAVFIEREK